MKIYDCNKLCCIASIVFFILVGLRVNAQHLPPKLDNPISKTYLKKNLRKDSPRLVLNKEIEENLKQKLRSDPVVQHVYKRLKAWVETIFDKPIINLDIPLEERSQNNQLDISRDLLHRIGILAMVYRIEKDAKVLNRINEELIAACNFPSWNPKHFLDVGEMSLGVALAIDWVGEYLPPSTVKLGKTALIEKGLKPSWPENGKVLNWVYGGNNWNQVCNGGMVAAAIVVAEEEPELASKTIYRAIDGMRYALSQYGPDGVYPEGATYWRYGTSFSVLTAAMFESAFGSDFGILEYPGLKESAMFRVLSDSPMGLFYNFGDCGESSGENGDIVLAWFASKTGNKTFFEEEKFLRAIDENSNFSRLLAPALVWIAQYEEKRESTVPAAWAGRGPNPVVFFTGEEDDPNKFYFGGKGGLGNISHGNMDAGSFVFELDGVRWSIDLGKNKHYGVIERTGFNLWDRCQGCDRWKLINKNNFGHSTLSVNDQLHVVDGKASIIDFKNGSFPEATFDMSPVFEGKLKSAKRRFKKSGPRSLLIEDEVKLSEETEMITWQLITQANVEIVDGGAILTQEGKRLNIKNLSHPEFSFTVISLNPPPFYLDLKKDNLKRLEIRIPAWTVEGQNTKVAVLLSGD
ncbi:heparinase II/III domain-containing protein [Cyclobacterium marinum]|uniref:Heparinase II/III family protein n=1 Tax=Cyclobacterium marinum (strain ATCC 25205 / DSM 745 / LMG 13164 / NCIMB 1802) TaxID=880070 RepID=G0IV11_CYCMS|nr:heparinase II/III family protein [Cyclobacterium marinum]AEL26235.1 heparinase II/III family protein [Cyclobacterium marinum DSM 745]